MNPNFDDEKKKKRSSSVSEDLKKGASIYKSIKEKVAKVPVSKSSAQSKSKSPEKWYKGDKPTETETLAKIVQTAETDRATAEKAYGFYQKAKSNGEWAETYDRATSSYIDALGIDPSMINDEWVAAVSPYLSDGVHTASGALSTNKKYGADVVMAANLSGLIKDYNDTKGLLAEEELAKKEALYWMSKGLSDDEIKAKLNIGGEGSKYKGLTAAINKAKVGEVTPTTAPIMLATSYGVDGMLWGLRNPNQSKGDYKLDAVQAQLGRGGKVTTPTEAEIARRTPGNAAWSPYTNGTTMDEEGILFGRTEFDQKWLDENRERILSSGTEAEKKAFANLWEAEQRTQAAEAELADFIFEVQSKMETDYSPDQIFTEDRLSKYPQLAAMQEGILKGVPVGLTRSVDFDYAALQKAVTDEYNLKQAQQNAPKDPAAMNTAVEAEKQAIIQQNGSLLSTSTTPTSLTNTIPSMYDDPEPGRSLMKSALWASNSKPTNIKAKQEAYVADQPTAPDSAPYRLAGAYADWSDEQKDAALNYISDSRGGFDPADAVQEMRDAGLTEEQINTFRSQMSEALGSGDYTDELMDAWFEPVEETEAEPAALFTPEEITTAIEEGENVAAADMQAADLDALIKKNPELMTTDNAQKGWILATALLAESGLTDDPEIMAKGKEYAEAAAIASNISEDGGGLYKWIDNAFGGALSQTADNKGIGLWETILYSGMSGAAKLYDVPASIAGWATQLYAGAVRLSNDLLNAVGIETSDVMADKISEAGKELTTAFDPHIEKYDTYLRENASSLEYFSATVGSEILKQFGMGYLSKTMGALSAAGKLAASPGAIAGTGLERHLKTAMDTVKIENALRYIHSAPFALEANVGEFEEVYNETGDTLKATLSGLIAAGVTLSTMDMGGFLKNIELSGRDILPEIMQPLAAVPGAGTMAHLMRGGMARLMWFGNVLATSANEGIQEAVEKVLTDSLTSSVEGKDLTAVDIGEYSKQVFAEGAMAFLANIGNIAGTFAPYSRTIKVIESQEQKSDFTADDAADLTKAFIEDLNDPQVMEDAAKRANDLAVEVVTGELIAEGALGEADSTKVDSAVAKADEATQAQQETQAELEQATAAAADAMNRLNENPSDPALAAEAKTAVSASNDARKKDREARLKAERAKAEAEKVQAEAKTENDGKMAETREQAAAEVESRKQEAAANQEKATVERQTAEADAMFGYSDEARAENLNGKTVVPVDIVQSEKQVSATDVAYLEQAAQKDAIKYVTGLVEKFGIFKKYTNQNAEIEFEFTKSGLKESGHYQAKRGGTYPTFAQILFNLDALVSSAIPIETHTDKYVGTKREDKTLNRVYVLLSAFRDGSDIVPVQFEVKEFTDGKESKLYVAVSLKKIEAADISTKTSDDVERATTASSDEETGRGAVTSEDTASAAAPSGISISDLVSKINPADGDFLKYIPDSMLNDEQREAKGQAVQKENEKIDGLKVDSNVERDTTTQPEASRTQVPPQTVQTNAAPNAEPPSNLGVSQFAAKTGQKTNVLSDVVKKELRDAPYYQKTSQKGNVDLAIKNIETDGYETRRSKLLDGTTNLYTPEGQAEAYVLAKVAKDLGDAEGESAIAFKVKESGTLLGQSLAMRRMYIEMTPEGKVQFIQRIVDQINQGYVNRGKDTRVEAPAWLQERIEQAGGDDAKVAKVIDDAYAFIAEQMPPDWKSRVNAWRYTAMLANPRTHIRNVVGNLFFMPAIAIKNKIGALAELTTTTDQRTKSLAPIKQEYKDFAKGQLDEVADILTGGGKHNPMDEIQSKRRTFNNSILEWLSSKNGAALEAEDTFFLNRHFTNALAGFLQARNVNLNKVDKAVLQEGLDYAISEAQKATYRDASEIADQLSKFTRDLSNSKKRSARAAGLLVEGALPFKKTPINVMRRGIEYSPVGLLNTLSLGLYDMKKGNVTKAEFIDRLASGLTGTGLALVGGWLSSLGMLKLKMDEPEEKLEELYGAQEYSIEIGGKSITIDWLSPSAMPLFVGGAIYELMQEDVGEFNLNTLADALKNIAEPVFNLSMLDGVNSLLSSASYSDNSVAGVLSTAAESYASQFVPSGLGAIARIIDPVRRTTYTDKNSGMLSSLQYLMDSATNKTPFLSKTGQPYLNAWGEEDVTSSVFHRVMENLVSPGYVNDLSPDDVEQALMELFDLTNDEALLPKMPAKYFTVNKERKDLTGEEYEQLTRERGQTAKALHEKLFADPAFLSLPAEYQVNALEYVWEYATQTAKKLVAPDFKTDTWIANSSDPANDIIEKATATMKKDQADAMKLDLYSAIDSGEVETAATYVAGIVEGGTEKKNLRTSITNRYKTVYRQMYEAGDVEGLRELESTLILLDVGYKVSDIRKWLDKE